MRVEKEPQCSPLPGGEFRLRKRIEEAVVDLDPPGESTESALPSAPPTHETGDRIAVAGNRDLLAGFNPSQQTRQVCFRVMNVDRCHSHPESYLANDMTNTPQGQSLL